VGLLRKSLAACLVSLITAGGIVSSGPAATWSSRGGLIVFWWITPWPRLWSMHSDGTHRRLILRTRDAAKRPRLSPDRQWVAFDGPSPGTSFGEFDIQIVRLNGTARRTLTTGTDRDIDAQWSPDGTLLSFTRIPPEGDFDWHNAWIWTVRPDGSDPRPLAPGLDGRWSPDGTKLVLDAATDQGYSDLFVVDADGTGRRQLTATPQAEEAAGWSPDGKKILFTRFWLSGRGSDVFVMNADGSNERRLTFTRGFDDAGSWSPDGKKILFTNGAVGSASLLVMNADGSQRHSISRDRFYGYQPSWR
jgi:TolB protein